MSKKLSANVCKVKVDNNLFTNLSFEDLLMKFNCECKADNDETQSKRYFYISTKSQKEISIYLDSFEHRAKFISNVFDDTICFLLAKDVKCLYENKAEGSLDNKNTEPDNIEIQSKLPTHCVYFKNSSCLIIQDGENATTSSEIEKGIKNVEGNVKITQLKRNDVIQQIARVASAIEKIDIEDLQLAEFLTQTDGTILAELMSDPDSKIKLTLNLVDKSDECKEKIIDLFVKSYKKEIKKKFNNLKISYKNNDGDTEAFELIKNLLKFKIEVDKDLSDFDSNKEDKDRLEISLEIYKELIIKGRSLGLDRVDI